MSSPTDKVAIVTGASGGMPRGQCAKDIHSIVSPFPVPILEKQDD
jgi:hypothetical protein